MVSAQSGGPMLPGGECFAPCAATPLCMWQDLITWGTPLAKERGCESLSSHENTRKPSEINKKNNDIENEPGHVWRLPDVLGLTRDNI